eukprot:1160295-Pelagomonas_calceolata.AAC.6
MGALAGMLEAVLKPYKGYKGKRHQSRRLTASLFINTHEVMKKKRNSHGEWCLDRAPCGRYENVEESCSKREAYFGRRGQTWGLEHLNSTCFPSCMPPESYITDQRSTLGTISLFNLKSVNPQPESGGVAKNVMGGKIQVHVFRHSIRRVDGMCISDRKCAPLIICQPLRAYSA